ncbi:hypothetical protein ADIS_1465 [Lunatimonas lonarensis]|uniref:Uncharacterized protein n=1 Tax=Lunatimonas lonarensis TaxID=1232681 RepID=R7ZV84_9BACT|nr:hypothetical protein [Lunatimonas lonarensis]EON78045.1 hypothetical protein ADIS_1465 [Lunatimonas lonarensis]
MYKKFEKWNTFFEKDIFKNLDVLVIFYGENISTITYYYEQIPNNTFRLLLIKDQSFIYENNLFSYINDFLLVNMENRIVAVGNPMKEKNIFEIFKYKIKQQNE